LQKVKAKKHLGQHFLNDLAIAEDIVAFYKNDFNDALVLEIGPGMGVLTDILLKRKELSLSLVEIDSESVVFLENKYPELKEHIIFGDFLKLNLHESLALQPNQGFGIIGNFPYNISSQIFFKVIEYKELVNEVVCMLQKEVAVRIASKPGNKDYGILSVLLQAYYDIEYGFTVFPHAFDPPPKVDSGVIRLVRNKERSLDCDFSKFKLVVKTAFNQRRKKLSNALKPLGVDFEHPLLDLRAERLDYNDFVTLTKLIFKTS
jgi:16S rRNA (adenine1518-N6/adenine1519-N6)-dimethyltransferase